jgi:hypothetical protein
VVALLLLLRTSASRVCLLSRAWVDHERKTLQRGSVVWECRCSHRLRAAQVPQGTIQKTCLWFIIKDRGKCVRFKLCVTGWERHMLWSAIVGRKNDQTKGLRPGFW